MPGLLAPVSGITEQAVVRAIRALTTFMNKVSPIAKFEYVTVTFNSSANADTDIAHSLDPKDPESVHYQVVKIDRAARIYNDTSATRKAWQTNVIYLRSDTGSAVATLLLSVAPGN